jgi:hypothetical protein
MDVGFGHIYVNAEPAAVIAEIARYVGGKGFERTEMTPDRHPKRMKEMHENQMRLYWISPRIGKWTGVFEFRFYNNEARERWGYSDEMLAVELSKALGDVWRLEVLDGAGFWMYARYAGGHEQEGKAYQDTPADRSTDPAHPRYELNRIIEREGFANIALGYEHIPGPQVSPIEHVPQSPQGILGLDHFLHLAFIPKGDGA